MFCWNCGKEIDNNAYVCVGCGVLVKREETRPKFYKAAFVLGILSLCIPMHGFTLGVIGLPMAVISKRKSAIVMNAIGIVIWLLFIVLCTIFAIRSADA